jgi:predicted membrane channel-forming protein YqfA (hemolysin III family)
MGGGEKRHWTAEVGWLAIFLAVAISITVFLLPAFEGGRDVAVGAVILPLVAIGAFLILLKRNRS